MDGISSPNFHSAAALLGDISDFGGLWSTCKAAQVLHAQSEQREDIALTQPWIKRVTSVFSSQM